MISYDAMFDELEKIGEDDNYVTKDRLKRHAKAVGAVMLGSGLGAGVGGIAQRYLLKPDVMQKIKKLPPSVLKYMPHAAGAIGGVAGLMGHLVTQKHLDYVKHGK